MLRLLLNFPFLFSPTVLLACDCQAPRGTHWSSARVERQLSLRQQVFIGHVFSVTATTFQVQVLDVFKGTINQRILTGTADRQSSCALPVEEGLWVFYTDLKADGSIPTVDACSFSGNLTDPALEFIPPPPSLRSPADSVASRHFMAEQRARQGALFTKNWLNEYTLLRAYHSRTAPQRSASAGLYVAIAALVLSLVALLLAVIKK